VALSGSVEEQVVNEVTCLGGLYNAGSLLTEDLLASQEGFCCMYKGADKSLALPGRKQATATEDSDVHISYL
jgi:hypothetical protein